MTTLSEEKAVAFFLEHAGYSWGKDGETEEQGRLRCARSLAKAEANAANEGFTYQWEIDPDSDSSEWRDDCEPYATWQCLARNGSGEVVASLGGIDFGADGDPWGDPYKRVVEAELAQEALAAVSL